MIPSFAKSPHAYCGIALLILIIAAAFAGCASQPDTLRSPAASTPAAVTTASPAAQSILVFCGAGLKAPMQEIGPAFTKKTGIEVQYNYGGAGTLVTQMNLTRKGDVFMPGSTAEWKTAKAQGLVDTYQLVAYHVPAIAVQKGNPKNIATVKDLARPGLKVALGDVNATAIGKASAKVFKKFNITSAVEKNVVTRTPTINELVTLMNAGQADAAIMTLDSISTDNLDVIVIPTSDNEVLITPIGPTTYTKYSDAAAQFAAYVASDEGKAFFARHGFPTYPNPDYANVQP
jgi:molybdate transport system substrate-binding protein